MQHNLGTYNNLKEVWNRYPNGGGHGDYVIIDGEKLYWNELQTSWGDYEYKPEIIRPGIVYEGDIKVEGTGTFHEGIKIGDSIPGYSGALIDEFGNADYRRIDTDSLFIRDEESGNLVSLAKYIVRFKTELPPNWAEYQKLPLFNSARLLLFDGTSESRYYTTIKDLKDAIAAQIEATSGGEGGGSSIVVIRSDDETVAPSDSNVYSALATLRQIDLALQFATGAFLSRVHRDNAEETITFDKGVQFGEYSSNINFGKGGAVDSLGNAELESLVLRSFLEVPELRYNRLTLIGDEIAIGAGGIIEEVEVLEEEVDGVLHEYHRLHMKLEEGEMIPFHISDICKGIYNHGQGFSTSYFSVLSVNQEEQYMDVNVPDSSLVPVNINRPPVKYMNIARWGNFDDPSRQSIIVLSAKTGNIIMYEGLSDYQKVDGTASGGISTQWGKAQGLEFIDDFDDLPIKENDSVLYVKNLLYKNLIKVDFKDNLIVEYRDRGNWSAETAINNPYRATPFMQDEVWHLNSKYRLVHDESTEEPIPSSTHWLLTTTLEVGKTVETYVKYFALSKSNTVAPDEWDTIPQVTTAIYKYLWAYEVTTYTNGDEDVVPPYVTGTYGDTGDSGATITKTIDYYGVSESEETEPETWLENEIPPKTPEQYLWNYERIEYSNGYVYETKKHVIQGKDPRSIESIKNQYIYSTSGTVSPSDTANWKDTIASLGARPANSFLWIRDYIDYTDGTHSVTKGRPIKEGSDGYNTATIYLHQRFSKDETITKPTGNLIYNFTNETLTPLVNLNGWTQIIPDGETQLYVIGATASSREDTDEIGPNEWSGAVKLGKDGFNSASITLYQRANTTPSVPQSVCVYTFSTGALTNIAQQGWSRTIPSVTSDKKKLYVTTATAISTESTDEIPSTEWAHPTIMVEDAKGIVEIKEYYALSKSSTEIPSDWGNVLIQPTAEKKYLWNYEEIIYTYGDPTETPPHVISIYSEDGRGIESITNYYLATSASYGVTTSTSGWTPGAQQTSPTKKYLWNYEVIVFTSGDPTTIPPHIIGTYGDTGLPGYNTATVSLYIRSKKRPTAISLYRYKYVFSNGGLLSLGGAVGEYEGWHRDMIEGEDPLWITSATIMSREETYTIETYEWTAPVIHTEHGGGVDPKNLFSLVRTDDYWGEFSDIIKDQYGTGLFLDTGSMGNIPAHVVYEEDQQYSLSLKARLDGNIDYGPSRYIWYMIHLKYEGLTNAITHLVYVHDTQADFDLEYVMLEYYDSSSDSIQADGAWVDTLPVKRANRYIHVRLKCGFSNDTISYKGYNVAFKDNRKIERVKLFYRSYAYTSNPTAQIQYWNRVNKRYPVGSPNASSDIDDEEIYLYFKYTDNVTVDQFLPFIDGPLIYLSGVSRRDKTLKSIELSFGRAYTYIYDPMLVKGPKILEFTPAPEDIFNEIETAVDKAAKLPYMAGEWDPTIAYHRTDTYPVVTLTGESNVRYYFLTAVVSLGENPSDNEKIWEYAPDFKMIITEALFSKNAKLGEFIFNGKKMFSQYGDLNGEADNPNYLVEGHKPYFEVDGETGKSKMMDAEIRGTVTTGTKDGERIEISSSNNSISIYDGSGKPTPRALFKPENVPAIGVVESVGGVSDYAIPTYSNEFTSFINDSFYGEYTLVNNTENKLLTFRVPPLNLMVKAIHDPSTNVDSSIYVSAILQTPKNQSVFLGYAYAEAGGGQFQESTMTVTTKTEDAIYIGNDSGLFRIRYDVEVRGHKNVPSTFVVAEMDCSPASTSDNRYIVSTNNPTNIYGLDGLVLLNSQNDYLYNNNGLFQVKKGSHGIRVSNTGVEILVNSQWKKVLTQ